MAPRKKMAMTIAFDAETDRLLTLAAVDRGVSRSEFVRQRLESVLEQYREPPKPLSAGVVRRLDENGDERSLFRAKRRRAPGR